MSGCGLPKTDEELRKLLSPEQYRIVRENGTERPFENAYWNHKAKGLYVDIVSGIPLFASFHKFDSGTGWPSFFQSINPLEIVERPDFSYGMRRTEVRSRTADSHLGHVFEDGPPPSGRRYCIYSAALRFVPYEELDRVGLGDWLKYFQNR